MGGFLGQESYLTLTIVLKSLDIVNSWSVAQKVHWAEVIFTHVLNKGPLGSPTFWKAYFLLL